MLRFAVPTVATLESDRRDAYLMSLFARLRLTPRGRIALLAGIAGFCRAWR